MTSHASQQIIDEISAQLAGGLELNFTSAHARKIYEISTELATHGNAVIGPISREHTGAETKNFPR